MKKLNGGLPASKNAGIGDPFSKDEIKNHLDLVLRSPSKLS
jgi:hypothetical protein